jgi:RNA polymerase sigma-70 factor (ECF subfamily)
MHAQTTTAQARDPGGPPRLPPDPPEAVPHELGSALSEFTDFYRASWPGVARALALALCDRDLAIDAADEAMARAYPRWDKLRGYDNPAGWVYRVGLNWARSHHRRLARRLPFAHPQAVEPAPVSDPAIRAALLELPLNQRSVVVCRLLLDWSVAETATALGLREATVRSRLHRALRSLEASLDHLR